MPMLPFVQFLPDKFHIVATPLMQQFKVKINLVCFASAQLHFWDAVEIPSVWGFPLAASIQSFLNPNPPDPELVQCILLFQENDRNILSLPAFLLTSQVEVGEASCSHFAQSAESRLHCTGRRTSQLPSQICSTRGLLHSHSHMYLYVSPYHRSH